MLDVAAMAHTGTQLEIVGWVCGHTSSFIIGRGLSVVQTSVVPDDFYPLYVTVFDRRGGENH